ncbi:MAG: FlxA-like family protein [Lachnospiraceae bacterium]|nr:FlxA-like family protein [Lachnospiraceae bacterium]
MAINSVNTHNSNAYTPQVSASTANTETKTLENQLMNKQQRLNSLSSDDKMSAEEKAKERQEIQKQIAELNRKLELQRMQEQEEAKEAAKKQEQLDTLKEEMTKETSSKEETKEETSKDYNERMETMKTSAADTRQILAANMAIQQARIQENVVQKNTQDANVLESEIKSDTLYGLDTQAKEDALAKMRGVEDFKIEEKEPRPMVQNDHGISPNAKIVIRE